MDIMSLLSTTLGIPQEQLSESLSMEQVDIWDSLTHMDLIAAIENEYRIELTADDIVAMTDVGSILRILKQRGIN